MRLLVLSPVFPDAPSDGDRVRLYHWLRQLGRRHEVHLACLTDAARPADASAGGLGKALAAVHRLPWSLGQRRLAAALRLAGPLPVSVSSAQSRGFRALVDGLLGQGPRFDAVLAYRLKMAPYALRFRGPRFLDYTDSLTRYTERRAAGLALKGRLLGARFQRSQARKLAAYEAYCAGQFNAGFFNARQDCEAVQAMAPGSALRLHTAANGVDAAAFKAPHARAASKELLFVGHLAYAPNADAVAWFAEEILPLVRAQEPEAFLSVVGGDAPAWLRKLEGRPGLRFLGFAPDTRPPLWRAAVSVCPVRTGAGRQNKLLEAFAAGLPCVSTPLAADGAEARDGHELLVAEDAGAFAAAVLTLLRRPALGRRLALQARALVKRRYDWGANAAGLERAMLAASRPPLW